MRNAAITTASRRKMCLYIVKIIEISAAFILIDEFFAVYFTANSNS